MTTKIKTYGISILAALVCGCESLEVERPTHVQTIWSSVNVPTLEMKSVLQYEKPELAELEQSYFVRKEKTLFCKGCTPPLAPLKMHTRFEITAVNEVKANRPTRALDFPPDKPPAISDAASAPVQLQLDTNFKSYRYAVLFRYGSYQIGPVGKKTIARAARNARNAGKIDLVGRVDNSGDQLKNEVLAENRVKAVGAALTNAGVRKQIIATSTSLAPEPVDLKNTYWGAKLPEVDALISRRVDIVVK